MHVFSVFLNSNPGTQSELNFVFFKIYKNIGFLVYEDSGTFLHKKIGENMNKMKN